MDADYGRNRHRDGEPRVCNRSGGSNTPSSRGTESSFTLRWREMDSNFRSLGTKRCFLTLPIRWLGAPGDRFEKLPPRWSLNIPGVRGQHPRAMMTGGEAAPGRGAVMRDTDLFRMALSIEPPWVVTKSEFDAAARRLDIHLDFARGSRFDCPECGVAGCPAYDSEEKTWRHLNFFQHEAYLHARVPRVTCKECGIKQVPVPWARSDSGFTLLFEALVMAMVQAMPVAVVARMVDEWDTRLWRIIHHSVAAARAGADHSEVTSIAFDETASRRGHNYVSLFVDLVRRRVLFVAEGKDAGTVDAFAADLAAHGGNPEAVAEVCIDMSPAFIAGIAQSLTNAQITFDKFHLVKLINEAVDAVRRAEQKSHAELNKSRYLWLKNPRNLSERQRAQLDKMEFVK